MLLVQTLFVRGLTCIISHHGQLCSLIALACRIALHDVRTFMRLDPSIETCCLDPCLCCVGLSRVTDCSP